VISRQVLAATLAAATFLLSAAIMNGPADRSHLIPDDASTRFVAATLASGHLIAKAPHEVGAFRPPLVVTREGRWFGKEYPVLPLLMAPGVPFRVEWVVNPLLAGLLVWGTFLLGRKLYDETVGLVGASLVALSPGLLALSSTFLNSLLSAVLLVFAAIAWLEAARRASFGGGVLGGFVFGAAFATRPYSAALMLVPLAFIPLSAWRADRRGASRVAFGLLLGGAPWVVGMILWNLLLSGNPWKTPYQVYASFNRLGFQNEAAVQYSPTTALADTWQQMLAYADAFLPLPWLGRLALVLTPIGALWALRARGIALWLAGLVLVAGHMLFFGVRSGSWALTGARYYFEATPAAALLVAFPWIRLCRWRKGVAIGLGVSYAAMFLAAALVSVPAAVAQARSYHSDPFAGSNRRLERWVRQLDPQEHRMLFVDVSTYNWGSAMLVNPPDFAAPNLVAIYRTPPQNRAVLNEFPGRSAYLVRWSSVRSAFEMQPYVPEDDTTGPPDRFPYTDMKRRGLLNPAGKPPKTD
jgi:4-amino-4-deoxy-L-arabinose transferase-like glycosyltransferase